MADIPKYIKYDFLSSIIGLVLMSSSLYYTVIIKITDNSLGIIFIIGLIFAVFGLGEMAEKYSNEKDIEQIKNILEKKEGFDSLKKAKIITKEQQKFLINSIKEEVKDFIKKKKED